MREVDKKDAPAISGGYTDPDSTINPTNPKDYPDRPVTGTGEDDLPIGTEPQPY